MLIHGNQGRSEEYPVFVLGGRIRVGVQVSAFITYAEPADVWIITPLVAVEEGLPFLRLWVVRVWAFHTTWCELPVNVGDRCKCYVIAA